MLKKAREAEEVLATKLKEVGNKSVKSLTDGFNAVIEKLNNLPRDDGQSTEVRFKWNNKCTF